MNRYSSDLRIRMPQNTGLLFAIVLFAVLYLVYNIVHPKGFSAPVLVQNADEAFSLALLAMAQTAPVLLGGLDLSVGAVMTMVNCLASHLVIGDTFAITSGIFVCLVSGTVFGLINGLIVVYGRLQPIIVTLASGAIALGLALLLRPKPGGKIDEDLSWALTNSLADFADTYSLFDGGKAGWFQPIAGIPVALLLLILVTVVVWLPLRRTLSGAPSMPLGRAMAPPICRACQSQAPSLPHLRSPVSSPRSEGCSSPSRRPLATPTSHRREPTRSIPSPQ